MAIRTISQNVETRPDLDKHPKGLYVLFATEMWERLRGSDGDGGSAPCAFETAEESYAGRVT